MSCGMAFAHSLEAQMTNNILRKMEFIDLKTQYQELQKSINGRIQTVLDHGQYIMGPEVQELETRLAAYTGASHCITVASGTEALLISLMAIGVGPGDEVITTAFSFIAAAEVIALLGAKPVFVDIEPDSCNIDVDLIERKMTSKTRAMIPVALYGKPADMDRINNIANKHGLVVIEDAAQSLGATYKGRKSTNLSTIGCTSFFPSKPLGCYGDGGAIFTSDEELAQIMRELRVHGQSRRYVHSRIGVGGRMDTLQCAVLLAKLDRFDWELEQRRKNGALYDELFGNRVWRSRRHSDYESTFAQYTIGLENRETVQVALKERGIPTAVHYPIPIPLQPAYAQFGDLDQFPVAVDMAKKVISLPMGPYMQPDAVHYIAESVLSQIRY